MAGVESHKVQKVWRPVTDATAQALAVLERVSGRPTQNRERGVAQARDYHSLTRHHKQRKDATNTLKKLSNKDVTR